MAEIIIVWLVISMVCPFGLTSIVGVWSARWSSHFVDQKVNHLVGELISHVVCDGMTAVCGYWYAQLLQHPTFKEKTCHLVLKEFWFLCNLALRRKIRTDIVLIKSALELFKTDGIDSSYNQLRVGFSVPSFA